MVCVWLCLCYEEAWSLSPRPAACTTLCKATSPLQVTRLSPCFSGHTVTV